MAETKKPEVANETVEKETKTNQVAKMEAKKIT